MRQHEEEGQLSPITFGFARVRNYPQAREALVEVSLSNSAFCSASMLVRTTTSTSTASFSPRPEQARKSRQRASKANQSCPRGCTATTFLRWEGRSVRLVQHVSHLLPQGARRERLLEEGDFRLQYPVPDNRIIGVTAQE